MKKAFSLAAVLCILGGLVFAQTEYGDDVSQDNSLGAPTRESVILRLDRGHRVTTDDIQRLFTAMTTSYLKSSSNYILASEIYRDRQRQSLPASLVIREQVYDFFTVYTIRYNFSNGYFEFKLSQSPFAALVKGEVTPSVDYAGELNKALIDTINTKLQEAVYISRGYATRWRRPSTASFYVFQ
jgi:hypothetical protein